jgi:hypothetical protein
MKKLFETYIFSNFHIALCAVSVVWSSYCFSDVPINYWLLTFVFSGTVITYSLHRIISGMRMRQGAKLSKRFTFYPNILFYKGNIWLVVFLLLASIALFNLTLKLQLGLIILSAISTLYVLPVLGSNKRLRDISQLKIFLISFVWAALFLIARLELPDWSPDISDYLLFSEKFIFIFALTLPFDLRDQQIDAHARVSTLANSISTQSIRNLMLLSILAAMTLIIVLLYLSTYSISLVALLFFFYILQAGLSYRVDDQTSESYYLFILDGLILLHGLIIGCVIIISS